MIVVSQLSDIERAEWDAYVNASVHGLPLHLSGWQDVLQNTYGYETPFLIARHETNDPANIAGVMPLFLVRSRLTGRRAVTMPGGICAEDAGAAMALATEAEQVATRNGLSRIDIQDTRDCWLDNYQTENGHVGWIVDVRGTRKIDQSDYIATFVARSERLERITYMWSWIEKVSSLTTFTRY